MDNGLAITAVILCILSALFLLGIISGPIYGSLAIVAAGGYMMMKAGRRMNEEAKGKKLEK